MHFSHLDCERPSTIINSITDSNRYCCCSPSSSCCEYWFWPLQWMKWHERERERDVDDGTWYWWNHKVRLRPSKLFSLSVVRAFWCTHGKSDKAIYQVISLCQYLLYHHYNLYLRLNHAFSHEPSFSLTFKFSRARGRSDTHTHTQTNKL